MGCGASSKSVGVIEVKPRQSPKSLISQKEIKKNKAQQKSATLSMVPLQVEKKNANSATDSGISCKQENRDNDSDVISEINSISSEESLYEDKEYKTIITEKSSKNLVQKVEKEFRERNLG